MFRVSDLGTRAKTTTYSCAKEAKVPASAAQPGHLRTNGNPRKVPGYVKDVFPE